MHVEREHWLSDCLLSLNGPGTQRAWINALYVVTQKSGNTSWIEYTVTCGNDIYCYVVSVIVSDVSGNRIYKLTIS